jgi:hypothetical protein
MELYHLRSLVAVAEEGNLTRRPGEPEVKAAMDAACLAWGFSQGLEGA